MNGIAFMTDIAPVTTQGNTQTQSAESEVSFADVLSGKIPCDEAATTEMTAEESNQTENVEETLSKLFDLIQSGGSKDEIAKLLESLTSEETKSLFDVLKSLIQTISTEVEEIKQGESTPKDLISVLENLLENSKDDENEIETAVIQEVIAMLSEGVSQQSDSEIKTVQETAQSISKVTLVEVETKAQFEIPTETLAQATAESGNNQKVGMAQATTQDVDTTQVENELQAVQAKLEKVLEVVEAKVNTKVISQEIKAEQSETTSQLEGIKLSVENEVKKLSLIGNKNTKTTTEFDELLASTQVDKTSQQPLIDNEMSTKTIEIPVEKQVSQEIVNQLTSSVKVDGTEELTLMLKPAELGEVAVKLVKSGGEITVSIMAQNELTQKLLEERLPTLISNLQATNSDVKDVQVVTPNQNATNFMNGFSLSDSNSNEQYNAKQPQTFSNFNVASTEEIEEVVEFHEGAKLWQTA